MALERAAKGREFRYSYDMLGEGRALGRRRRALFAASRRHRGDRQDGRERHAADRQAFR